MFEELAGGELLDVARDATRAERSAIARRLIAVGRFCQQRLARITGEHDYWCVDDWEAIAAEVGAELGISRGRASSQMHYGMTLIERLPRLAEVFLGGDVDFAVFANIDYRTGLITDKDVLAKIDAVLASKAPHWTTFSSGRTYTTKPGGALFFPQLAIPTGKLILPATAATPSPNRGLAMPTRRCTRKEERAYRIAWERGINRARYAANPPPY